MRSVCQFSRYAQFDQYGHCGQFVQFIRCGLYGQSGNIGAGEHREVPGNIGTGDHRDRGTYGPGT